MKRQTENKKATLTVAAAQMNSSSDLEQNLASITQLTEQARGKNVDLLLLPENAVQMPARQSELKCEQVSGHVQQAIAKLAREKGIYIVLGSLAVQTNNSKPYARSLAYDPNGQLVCHYDKIHLFDVEIPDGLSYRESDNYQAGECDQNPIFDLGQAKVGLTVCYDIRFPELYRQLTQCDANIICVPAAFTYETGEAHWLTLLKARAIENQVFIIAAGQVGEHASGRRTWGHSVVIDPWGNILAEAQADNAELVICQIDLIKQKQLRTTFPVLKHQRLERS